jgi:carbamoyltransferase
MKLLGLRLCEHDSNISYYDGEQVHYIKTERLRKEKHHAYKNLYEWESDIKNIWGISIQDIDQVGIVLDPWHYGLPPDPPSIFPHIDYSLPLQNTPILKVDHHYAHALSHWPFFNQEISNSIVIDGFGDYNIAWTIFKNNQIIDQGFVNTNGSIGIEMSNLGNFLGLKGNGLDHAGKVMGLQSYGRIDYEFLNSLKNINMFNIKEAFNIKLWESYKKDPLLINLTLLDWVHTVHFKVGEILLEFFQKYFKKDDIISYTGGVAQNVIWNTKLKKYFPNLVTVPHCNDEGLSLGIIEYLRRINNLPKFKSINFPYIGYQKEKNLYEQTRRAIQGLTSRSTS